MTSPCQLENEDLDLLAYLLELFVAIANTWFLVICCHNLYNFVISEKWLTKVPLQHGDKTKIIK